MELVIMYLVAIAAVGIVGFMLVKKMGPPAAPHLLSCLLLP